MSIHKEGSAGKLRVGVLFGNKASAAKFIMRADQFYGYHYTMVMAYTDNPKAKALSDFKEMGIPCYCLDWNEFGEINRARYFQELVGILKEQNLDIIICSGFMRILPDWFIQYFPCIINVHPAPLNILGNNQYPLYAGRGLEVISKFLLLHATEIASGERVEIRSTAHLIQAGQKPDCGTILAFSQPCVISQKETPQELLERVASLCDGQALVEALHGIILQRIQTCAIIELAQTPTLPILPLLKSLLKLVTPKLHKKKKLRFSGSNQ